MYILRRSPWPSGTYEKHWIQRGISLFLSLCFTWKVGAGFPFTRASGPELRVGPTAHTFKYLAERAYATSSHTYFLWWTCFWMRVLTSITRTPSPFRRVKMFRPVTNSRFSFSSQFGFPIDNLTTLKADKKQQSHSSFRNWNSSFPMLRSDLERFKPFSNIANIKLCWR